MRSRFSDDIKSLLERLAHQPLTVGDVLAQPSRKGYSLLIALLVLPFLFPMPPGLTGPFGSACLILSLQMALGRRVPWLPKRIARFKFPRTFALQLLQNLKKLTRLLEKITRPRLLKLAHNPIAWRLNGVCISWLTILLILPIPFTNPIPTVGILLLSVASLEADGLLMCICYLLTAMITFVVGFIGYTLWHTVNFLPMLF